MKYLAKNKHWQLTEDYNIDKILYLLIDRPNYNNDYIFIWGNKYGEHYHRDYDFPAYTSKRSSYCVCWFMQGKKHRSDDKPAKIWNNDYKDEYWVDDKFVKAI